MIKKEKIWTIANLFSILRLLISPLLIYFIYLKEYNKSFILFLILAFTDYIDGKISRKTKTQTKLGSILDQFSDKILIFCTMIALYIKGIPNYLFIFFLILIIIGTLKMIEYFIFYLNNYSEKKLKHSNPAKYLTAIIYIWLSSWLIETYFIQKVRNILGILVIILTIIFIISRVYNEKK